MAEEQTGERTRRSVSGELEEAREELAALRKRVAQLESAAVATVTMIEFAALAIEAARKKAGAVL